MDKLRWEDDSEEYELDVEEELEELDFEDKPREFEEHTFEADLEIQLEPTFLRIELEEEENDSEESLDEEEREDIPQNGSVNGTEEA